jgi:hypothetical protein
MIRTLSAFTEEIDDIELAVSDILRQIAGKELLAHSIGLVSCVPAFLETGAYAAIVEALPFDIVGQTTIAAGAPGSGDLDILSLLVLSSDDLDFTIGLTEPISTENEGVIAASYHQLLAQTSDKPPVSLILAYAPLLLTVGGDYFVRAFDEASGGIPLFGSLAVDNTIDYHTSQVFYQTEAYADRIAYVLVHGATKPQFFQATIPDDKIVRGTGVVTASDGNIVKEIDGAPALQFLLSKGLATDDNGDIQGLNSFPYIVDYNDGTDPVIRVIFAVTPEGHAVCLGDIPEGSTLSIGYFDDAEILKSTAAKLNQLPADSAIDAVLIFSCIGRYLTLGFDPAREIEATRERLDRTGIPYTFTYSGGEICPLRSHINSEALTNRFHNSTFTMVVL